MLKKEYHWKRFWCPRSGRINLDYEGYLHDPDSSEFGAIQNPDLVSSETIADIPCLILLGEPGMGKTQEIKELEKATENTGNKTLLYELGAFTNLKDDLFRDEEFKDWLNGTYPLYLFLDSLDEGRLTIQNIAQGLGSELKRQKYKDHINGT